LSNPSPFRDFHVRPGSTRRCNSGSRWDLFVGNEPHDCFVWYFKMMEAKVSQVLRMAESEGVLCASSSCLQTWLDGDGDGDDGSGWLAGGGSEGGSQGAKVHLDLDAGSLAHWLTGSLPAHWFTGC